MNQLSANPERPAVPGKPQRCGRVVSGVHPPGANKSAHIIAAAAAYFLIVFCVGLVLGPVRVYWLEPRLGESVAVLCEAPFLSCAIVLAARWLPRKFGLRPNLASLVAMGVGALFLQQLADLAVGAVRGVAPAQQLAHLSTPAGLIYAALLVAFVAMPVLANWPQEQRADPRSAATPLHLVKVVHTMVWAFFASCILAIPVLAWRGRFGSVMVLAILVLIEIVVLITHEWRCPLTKVAEKYTDDRSDNFDIYLPLWLARRNKPIFGCLFALGLIFALALCLGSISFRV
jgi:hypothetical protein